MIFCSPFKLISRVLFRCNTGSNHLSSPPKADQAAAGLGQRATDISNPPCIPCARWGLPLQCAHAIGDRADYRGLFTLSPDVRRDRHCLCDTFPTPMLPPERSPLATTLSFGARTFLSRQSCGTNRQRPSGPLRDSLNHIAVDSFFLGSVKSKLRFAHVAFRIARVARI